MPARFSFARHAASPERQRRAETGWPGRAAGIPQDGKARRREGTSAAAPTRLPLLNPQEHPLSSTPTEGVTSIGGESVAEIVTRYLAHPARAGQIGVPKAPPVTVTLRCASTLRSRVEALRFAAAQLTSVLVQLDADGRVDVRRSVLDVSVAAERWALDLEPWVGE